MTRRADDAIRKEIIVMGNATVNTRSDRTMFLRRSLQLDGVASGLCGVLLLAGAAPVSTLIGLAEPGFARAVGALLVLYAAALLYNGARATISRVEAVAAVVLNAGWVVGSAAVILAGPLTTVGNLAVAAVAAAVLLFAVLEVVGLARVGAGSHGAPVV
jgi:hypothetical protein